MRIENSNEIELFLARCRENLLNDEKNQFVGIHVTKKNEHAVQKAMRDAGFPEFSGDEGKWPSLFLRADDWENTPYHRNVSLDLIRSGHFRFETEKMAGHELFNTAAIQKDPRHELNDWMKLRAMDRNFDAVCLWQDDDNWMLDSPGEAETNDPPARRAHGKVLTFGLGIGYFLYMALLNPAVSSVTVVEKSPQVIGMFERFLQPRFPQEKKIRLIEADAFDLFHEPYLAQYDYIYTDIWRSSDDGITIMEKLLMQYCLPVEKGDFWIEDSCFEPLWNLSYLCFDEIVHHVHHQAAPAYQNIYRKIRYWYENDPETVRDADRLKNLMYDPSVLRHILAQQI